MKKFFAFLFLLVLTFGTLAQAAAGPTPTPGPRKSYLPGLGSLANLNQGVMTTEYVIDMSLPGAGLEGVHNLKPAPGFRGVPYGALVFYVLLHMNDGVDFTDDVDDDTAELEITTAGVGNWFKGTWKGTTHLNTAQNKANWNDYCCMAYNAQGKTLDTDAQNLNEIAFHYTVANANFLTGKLRFVVLYYVPVNIRALRN